MATKTATKTAAKTTAKETTMNDTTKLTAEERKAKREAGYVTKRADHQKAIDELVATGTEPKFDSVVWFINVLEDDRKGAKRPSSPLHMTGKWAEHDKQEEVYLSMAAALYGWDDNAYATTTQAAKYHGVLKDGAQGWVCQSGDTFWFTAYPYSAFEWDTESGEPEYDDEKGAERDAYYAEKRARSLARQAKAAQKEAAEKRKAAPKNEQKAATKVYRITMPDGTILEAPSIAELKELKALYA